MEFKPWPLVISDEFNGQGLLGCDFPNFTSAVFVSQPGLLFITRERTPAQNLGEVLKSNGYYEIDLLMVRSGKHLKLHRLYGDTDTVLDSGVLLPPATVEGKKGYCIIDTGAFMTSLDADLMDKSVWQIKSYPGYYSVDAKGNQLPIHLVLLDSFVVGGFDLGKDTEVGWREMKDTDYFDSKKEKMPLLGVIGVDILRKYNAVIDFGNRKLYFQR